MRKRRRGIQVWVGRSLLEAIGLSPYYAGFARQDDGTLVCETIDDNGNAWTQNIGLREAVIAFVSADTNRA